MQKNCILFSLFILYTAALERVVWYSIQKLPLVWSQHTLKVVVHSQVTAQRTERAYMCAQAINIYQTVHMQISWTEHLSISKAAL